MTYLFLCLWCPELAELACLPPEKVCEAIYREIEAEERHLQSLIDLAGEAWPYRCQREQIEYRKRLWWALWWTQWGQASIETRLHWLGVVRRIQEGMP